MGLFGDLDVSAAADDPFRIDDGTYGAVVTKFEVGNTKSGDKKGLTIEFTVNDGGSMEDRKVSEWKWIPQLADPRNPTAEEARAASFLKMRLSDLGVPEDRMNTVTEDDVMGTEVTITVKHNEKTGYTNVNKVRVKDSGSNSAGFTPTVGSPSDNPFLV